MIVYAPTRLVRWDERFIELWILGQWNRCAIARDPDACLRIQNLWNDVGARCGGYYIPHDSSEARGYEPFTGRPFIIERAP